MCLAYGIENLGDCLSSAVVLWRFFAPTTLNDAMERKLQRREQRADVTISAILVGLGLGVVIPAMVDAGQGAENVQEMAGVVIMSFFSIWFFSILSCLKLRYAVRLQSHSLKKDGICSLIGTIMGVALFFNTLIIAGNEEAWWINPLVALLVGNFALLYGIYGLRTAYKQGLPISSCDWWRGLKEGRDEDDAPSNVELPSLGSDERSVV